MKMELPDNPSTLLREGQVEKALQVGRSHLRRYYPYLLAMVFNEGQVVRYSPVYLNKYIETLPKFRDGSSRYKNPQPKLELSSLPKIRDFAASEAGQLAVAAGIEDFNVQLNSYASDPENPLTVKDFRELANLSLNAVVGWEDSGLVPTNVYKHKRRIGIEAIQGIAAWRYPEPQIAPPDQPAVWQIPLPGQPG